jgi:hypothetical protein
MLKVVEDGAGREAEGELFELDTIALAGARRMLMAALKMEAADYVERHGDARDAEGWALVVRNGRSKGRKLTLAQRRNRSHLLRTCLMGFGVGVLQHLYRIPIKYVFRSLFAKRNTPDKISARNGVVLLWPLRKLPSSSLKSQSARSRPR